MKGNLANALVPQSTHVWGTGGREFKSRRSDQKKLSKNKEEGGCAASAPTAFLQAFLQIVPGLASRQEHLRLITAASHRR
jgi:hypothetical protein